MAIAACGTALGPTGGWLYETGFIGRFDLGIWLVVVLGMAGVAAGAYAVRRGAWALGGLSLIVNAAVAALYGFPAVFSSLGGAR